MSPVVPLQTTRNQIVYKALARLYVHDSGAVVPPDELADAVMSLNLMLQEWAMRVDLPLRRVITLFPNRGQASYSADADAFAASYETFTATDIRPGASTTDIDVAGYAGTSGNMLAFYQPDGTLTTAVAPGVTATTITVPGVLAADTLMEFYQYVPITRQFLQTLAVTRQQDGYDTPVDIVDAQTYERLATKQSLGPITQVYDDRQGRLFAWPTSDGGVDRLTLRVRTRPDELLTADAQLELPAHWHNAVIWCLARELISEYDVTERVEKRVLGSASRSETSVFDFDREETSIFLRPATHWGY